MKDQINNYTSCFINWYEKATVRSSPRRLYHDSVMSNGARNFFSPSEAPISNHYLINKKGNFDKILLMYLYNLLLFTAHLELMVVNLTCSRIARNLLPYQTDILIRLDAHKIYCDEAYHALFSADFMNQIRSVIGVDQEKYERYSNKHPFFETIDKLYRKFGPKQKIKIDLLATVVSETMITTTLKHLPRDPSVIMPVREIIKDHAIDEGRHHIFFEHLFKEIWPQFDSKEKLMAGIAIPQLISSYLTPNFIVFREYLSDLGYDHREIKQILTESYTEEDLHKNQQSAAANTLKSFHKTDLFDIPEIYSNFIQAGFNLHTTSKSVI